MLTYKRAKELFLYDRRTGKLYWRKKPAPRANRVKVGAEAGNVCKGTSGKTNYLQTSVDQEKYLVHRIIWLLSYGRFPSDEIDHEDGNGLNNRLRNLRDVAGMQQRLNCPKRTDNTSGHTGISWHRKARKWIAQIQHGGVNHYLGLFTSQRAALAARKEASEKLGFHKNHGR